MSALSVLSAVRAMLDAPSSDFPSQALRYATDDFVAEARREGRIPAEVYEAMKVLEGRELAWVFVMLGLTAETGGVLDAAPHVVAILKRLLTDVRAAPEVYAPEPLDALREGARLVVAHLARVDELRAEAAADLGLMSLLEEMKAIPPVRWVHELLKRCSGTLMILHGPSRRVLRAEFKNLGTCFHLFTMLQGAIGERLPGGQIARQAAVDAAKGWRFDEQDQAWWHYQNNGGAADMERMVWGEDWTRDLPTQEGIYWITLWPATVERRWSSGFFGPALEAAPPSLVIEAELSDIESEAWFAHLGEGRQDFHTSSAEAPNSGCLTKQEVGEELQ